ncbi:MAG: glycosyltransferase [Bacteroidetes bacterium]|nr:MAG: glycosyltransferase [Bacteroidota bacterium]RLD86402.1 MAG: glycosyltransferase [Bacteroidota bacterium]
MQTINVLGYNVFSDNLNHLDIDKKHVISTINPHSYVVAEKDRLFKEALMSSDVLLPDGIGIIYASKILVKRKIKRITGADIHHFLLKQMNSKSGKVFYMGSSERILRLISHRLKSDYTHISCSYYAPPFTSELSEEENNMILASINSFQPDVLFVGMTAPKQEKWVYKNKNQIEAGIICSIGAVFDFYAGTIKRPPNWMISLKLEWLGRLLKEPKRMWKRNFISTPLFIKDIISAKLRTRNNKTP